MSELTTALLTLNFVPTFFGTFFFMDVYSKQERLESIKKVRFNFQILYIYLEDILTSIFLSFFWPMPVLYWAVGKPKAPRVVDINE